MQVHNLELKRNTAFGDTPNSRYRQGLINGIDSMFKAITVNLDASDGEYYNDFSDKISRDKSEFDNLIKNQISVTTSVINSFSHFNTIQKVQVDEETFNQGLKRFRKAYMIPQMT